MTRKARLSQKDKDLIRRYLIWCYKTTREELDKIDRYFTQLDVDGFVLKQLRKARDYKPSAGNKTYRDSVDQFQAYMKKKEANVLKKKFKKGDCQEALNPDYQYLRNRCAAIEESICYFLGTEESDKIRLLYEQEMTRRILEAREHA